MYINSDIDSRHRMTPTEPVPEKGGPKAREKEVTPAV
jgi:hypothetical protein